MAAPEDTEVAAIHAKIPRALYERLIKHRDELRRKDPMANLSDAIRTGLDAGLPGKRR